MAVFAAVEYTYWEEMRSTQLTYTYWRGATGALRAINDAVSLFCVLGVSLHRGAGRSAHLHAYSVVFMTPLQQQYKRLLWLLRASHLISLPSLWWCALTQLLELLTWPL